MTRTRIIAGCAAVALLGACSSGDGGGATTTSQRRERVTVDCQPWNGVAGSVAEYDGPAPDAVPSEWYADNCLRLNHLQVIGSHNSYHRRTPDDVFELLHTFDAGLANTLDYDHPPLAEQFDTRGVRQIELDVFHDPEGGLYADRHIYTALAKPIESGEPALDEPGFKVLHVQDVDFNSSCLTFVACLEQVRDWSDGHPTHLPIAILVEAKDGEITDPANLGFITPLPIDADALRALDAEVRTVFDAERIITPDDVRGDHASVEESILAGDGWPTLGESRGKVLFLLDSEGQGATYVEEFPGLEGAVFFPPGEPGRPETAFLKRNDPVGDAGDAASQIAALVQQGYVVRTRADADTIQARSGDTAQRDLALGSGAQWVSTDYPVEAANPFGTGYFASIPDGTPARCNPVNTGPRCTNDALVE